MHIKVCISMYIHMEIGIYRLICTVYTVCQYIITKESPVELKSTEEELNS